MLTFDDGQEQVYRDAFSAKWSGHKWLVTTKKDLAHEECIAWSKDKGFWGRPMGAKSEVTVVVGPNNFTIAGYASAYATSFSFFDF